MENNTVEYYLEQLPTHYDDLDWLSKCAIHLGVLMYGIADDIAKAKAFEDETALQFIDAKDVDTGKRISVSEADKRAIVASNDAYEKLKMQSQAVQEVIQSIKKRLDAMGNLIKLG